MNKADALKFSHVKVVVAGLLTTRSLVRQTAEIVYRANYPNAQARQKAVIGHLHSLGVPEDLKFGDFATLYATVFPDVSETAAASPFPIDIQYDQDNCHYTELIGGAAELDMADSGLSE